MPNSSPGGQKRTHAIRETGFVPALRNARPNRIPVELLTKRKLVVTTRLAGRRRR